MRFQNGLNHQAVRIYLNPLTGRFNALDSFKGDNEDPQSLNKYAYTACDPGNGLDPSGKMTLLEIAIVGSIFVGLAALTWQTVVKKHNPLDAAIIAVTAAALTFLCIALLPEIVMGLSAIATSSTIGGIAVSALLAFFATNAYYHLKEVSEVLFGGGRSAAERSAALLELVAFAFVICASAEAVNPGSTALSELGSVLSRNTEKLSNIAETAVTDSTGSAKIIPDKALDVLKTVLETGKAPDGHVGGQAFQNREGLLPPGGEYYEYDVNPKPPPGSFRDALRIVIDAVSGRAWYTDDHYATFIEIK